MPNTQDLTSRGWYQWFHFASISSPHPGTIWVPTTIFSRQMCWPHCITTLLRTIFLHLINKTGIAFESQNRSSSIWSQVSAEWLFLNVFIHKQKESLYFPFLQCLHMAIRVIWLAKLEHLAFEKNCVLISLKVPKILCKFAHRDISKLKVVLYQIFFLSMLWQMGFPIISTCVF